MTGLYLRGSLAFGEYFPGRSDVDFTAVLADRPVADQLTALASAHAAVYSAHPVPHFDGFHLLRADLACPPGSARTCRACSMTRTPAAGTPRSSPAWPSSRAWRCGANGPVTPGWAAGDLRR